MNKLSNKFYEIKKKHVIWAIVKSAVCALSLGLFITGVLLLALKLSAVNLSAGYYALIGIGVALIGGGLLFVFLFNPTDKQVAKRTDDDYALNERVQTALAYSDSDGTIVQLQREDAEERIKNLPSRKFTFARIWQFIAIFAVALAIGVAGITVPARAGTGQGFVDPDQTPRQVTELELAGVRELIANIEASSLSDELKTSVGGVLEQLLTDLETVNTEGTLAHAVNTAIDDTRDILSSTVSYLDIGAALTQADQIYLGQAVTSGGNVYKFYSLTVYDEVRVFDIARYDAANAKVGKNVTSLRNDLTATISSGLSQLLGDTAYGIKEALSTLSVYAINPLYILLDEFADGLEQIKSNIGGSYGDTEAQNEISELVSKFIVGLTNETSTQAYQNAIGVFVSNRLKIIFGYSPLELPIVDTDKNDGEKEPDENDPNGPNTEDPDNQSGGGKDTGETEYGSDDMVWVPGRGYMKYGDVIDEYYDLVNQYLHSDELTEEQKNMIRAYYDILFGSNKNK